MANYLTVRLTDDPSAVRFFQKLTLSLSFRAETERFSKIVGTFILSISNNSASVAAHIRRLIIDTALSVLQVWRFEQLLTRATLFASTFTVLQVWRFEQLLTGTRTRLLARRVLQVWRSSSYLPVAMEPGPCIGFCRYGVSSSYLPPTRKWVRLRCFASMAFRAVTCRTNCALNYVKVLQVWRFEQLLAIR